VERRINWTKLEALAREKLGRPGLSPKGRAALERMIFLARKGKALDAKATPHSTTPWKKSDTT
jgi:hypothetical protein